MERLREWRGTGACDARPASETAIERSARTNEVGARSNAARLPAGVGAQRFRGADDAVCLVCSSETGRYCTVQYLRSLLRGHCELGVNISEEANATFVPTKRT